MVKHRIARLRKEHGLNQKEFGDKINVAQTTVSAWEIGRNDPDNETLKKIADLFGVTFEYICGRNYTRKDKRLTEEEESALWDNREREEIEEDIRITSQGGLTDDELKEISRNRDISTWQKDYPDLFFESYMIEKACEYMSAEQRKRLLNIVIAAFPKAFSASYNPD